MPTRRAANRPVRRWTLALALAALGAQAPLPAAPATLHGMPSLVLWAWERPEDLRAVGADVGVAFLAQTISFDAQRLRIDGRRWPLLVDDAASLMAVTRIEFTELRTPRPGELARSVDAIVATASFPRVAAVQIDFDAVASQRTFYRERVTRVRERLGRHTPLSVTALASWCVGDAWLDHLPVDEAVPMLFQLGPLDEPYRNLAASTRHAHASCRAAIGTSLAEPLNVVPEGRRVYVFSPRPWNAASVRRARTLAGLAAERS